MEWLGQADINFTHAPSPRSVREKDGTQTDLLKILEEVTPPCHLNPLLFNGHLQTMWTATKPAGPKVYYKRKIFDADHKTYQGTFAVDFVVEPFEESDPTLARRNVYFTEDELAGLGSDDSKPMLVVMHGLSGGSHEVYLRCAIEPLIGDGGWEVCVVNSRGCARSKITSSILYNARATWDVRQVRNSSDGVLTSQLTQESDSKLAEGEVPQPSLIRPRIFPWRKHAHQCKMQHMTRIILRMLIPMIQYCGEEGANCRKSVV